MSVVARLMVKPETIPGELKALPRWIVTGDDKVPYSPTTCMKIDPTNPANGTAFHVALAALDGERFTRLGFILAPEDGLIALDWDDCRDPLTGAIDPGVLDELAALDTYTEISPSGTGLRAFAVGTLPPGRRKRGMREAYSDSRYVSVTGNRLAGLEQIAERAEQLAEWHRTHFGSATPRTSNVLAGSGSPSLDDDAVLGKARAAANGDKFCRLWAGDTGGHGGDDSAADLALLAILAFWTQDAGQLDRLFRRSGLYRPKWERSDYRERTIALALERTEVYTPGGTLVRSHPNHVTSPNLVDRVLPPVPSFPLDVLPDPIRRYVAAAAAALGAPPDFIAVAVLGLAEGTMGASRQLRLKDGYVVSPGGWYCLVGEPGTAKTPAMKAALRLIEFLEQAAHDRFTQRLDEWHETPKEERGPRPRREHYFVTDSTMEALGDALESSIGVTQYEDELLRRLKSLDAYRKGGDRQALLSMWSNAPVKITRKTSGAIYLPAPCAPIVGATQPDVLAQLRGDGIDAELNDGWVPRFCVVWPDADVPEWTEDEVAPEIFAAAQAVFLGLRLDRASPLVVTLSAAAREEWTRWHAENRLVQKSATGLAAQWAAKAPFHLARLTLTLHALQTVARDRPAVSAVTMRDSIELVEYFRGHLVRVLPAFGGRSASGGAGLAARIVRGLGRQTANDGWMSTTDLHRALGNSVSADNLRTVLDGLTDSGRVEHRQVLTSSKPASAWRLVPAGESSRSDRRYEESEESRSGRGLPEDSSDSSYLRNDGMAKIPDPQVSDGDDGEFTWEVA